MDMDGHGLSAAALVKRRDILALGVSQWVYEKWKREGVIRPIPATRRGGRYAMYRREDVVRLVGDDKATAN